MTVYSHVEILFLDLFYIKIKQLKHYTDISPVLKSIYTLETSCIKQKSKR